MSNADNPGNGQVPVPYSLENEVAPAHTYYYPDYAITQGDDDGLDVARLGRALWKRKWWLLAALLVGTGAGWGVGRLVPAEYEASATLSVQDPGTQRNGPIQTSQVLPSDGWTDVFRSRELIGRVVDRMGLRLRVSDEAFRGLFQALELGASTPAGEYALSVAAGGRWRLERADEEPVTLESGAAGDSVGATLGLRWAPDLSDVAPGSRIEFSIVDRRAAVGDLRGRLNVSMRPSAIIAARLTWDDPYEAADILNTMSEEFIAFAKELTSTKIREEVALLQQQTGVTSEQLEDAEFRLQTYRVNAITEPSEPLMVPMAPQGPGSRQPQSVGDPVFGAFAQNKVLADQLQMELQQVESIRAQLANGQPLNTLALQYIPSANQSAELKAAISQLQNARLNRRTLLHTYTEQAPEVVTVTEEIEELENNVIPAALTRLAREIQNQIDLINNQIENQGQQLREVPGRTIQTARLTREVAQAASLHSTLLSRLKQAELAAATAGPGIEVLDPAWPDPQPLGEKPGRMIFIFSMLGLGLGVAGVIVFDQLDRRIHSPDQVTGSLGLPVLAVVPRLEAAPDPASPAAAIAVESFRGLRTQMAHVDGKATGVTLITSPAPREGKSMVSANLAISYATAGYRTLLIDGDTRRGRAQEMFNLKRSPGLTDYLMKRASLEEALQSTSVENLALIARGAPGGFNADLLESDRMKELLIGLREDYDVIVIDGPPLAAGADALLLGTLVDKVVVVLRAGATTEDLAKAKLEALGNVDLPIVGAVLNALPKSAPDYEYYVHYYYADADVAS